MKKWAGGRFWGLARIWICLAVVGLGLGACAGSQDQLDQAALRRRFGIADDIPLVSYQGYPARAGFGQREGLQIRAVFKLDESHLAQFRQQAGPGGWLTLPMPATVRARIKWPDLPAGLDGPAGYYFCRTAGDDVLNATRTRPCAEAAPDLDIILGILELPGGQLSVLVRAGY